MIAHPIFIEPVREPEPDEWGTGFEFEPDPDMVLDTVIRGLRAPFRPDWERARMEVA